MRTSSLFGAKHLEFFKIYGVSARTREEGFEAVRTFFGQGGREGVNFSRFCADIFYGRPLTKSAPINGFVKATLSKNGPNV